MNTESFFKATALCGALGTLALAVLLGILSLEYRQVVRENSALNRASEQSVADATAISKQEFLEAKDQEISRLSSQIQELQHSLQLATTAAEATVPAANQTRQAFKVKTYLGDDYLGSGWVYSENLTRDKATGQVVFEPVLRLPASLKRHFVEVRTNIVERQVAATPTVIQPVQTHVYPQPYYYSSFPLVNVGTVRTVPTRASSSAVFRPTTRIQQIPANSKPLIGSGTAAPWAKPF